MNKYVYLFEFDSVLKKKSDIVRAQEAAFRELVINGNGIVFSMNQIADAITFQYVMKDEQIASNIIDLFKRGYMRISMYGDYRTPSQYMQDSIKTTLNETKDTFVFSIFSGLLSKENLVDTEDFVMEHDLLSVKAKRFVLESIRDALKFGDYNYVDPDKNPRTNMFRLVNWDILDESNKKELRQRVSYTKHCIELILSIGLSQVTTQPPKGKTIQFWEFMKASLEEFNAKSQGKYVFLNNMSVIYKKLWNDSMQSVNRRSNWYKEIENNYKEFEEPMKLWVDLCYNFTVEARIDQVSKHYNYQNGTFAEDFFSEFEARWNKLYKNDYENKNPDNRYIGKLWKTAQRICDGRFTGPLNGEIRNYNDNMKAELIKSRHKVNIKMVKLLLYTVMYILLFVLITLVMDWVEDNTVSFMFGDGNLNVFQRVADICIFSLLGAFVSEKTEIPDISESFISLGETYMDSICIRKFRKKYRTLNEKEK